MSDQGDDPNDPLHAAVRLARLIMENMPSGLFVYELGPDDKLRLAHANPEAMTLRTEKLSDLRGREFEALWPEATAHGITDKFIEVIKTGRTFRDEQLSYADEQIANVVRVRAFRLDDTHVAVAFEDITERHVQEQQLRASEERFRVLAQASTEGVVFSWNNALIDVNHRVVEMLGYTREELIGMSPAKLTTKESTEAVIKRVGEGESDRPYSFRFDAKRKDGSTFPAEAHGRLTTYRGQPVRLTVVRDRSEEARTQSLEQLAMTDALTGLHNHRYFSAALREATSQSKTRGEPLALLFIDIDHFKTVNDKHGHPEGDAVLKELAQLLEQETRRGDTVARYGGEEFAVLISGADSEEALRSAERIRRQVERTPLGAHALPITVTIGVAVHPGHADDHDALFAASDKALYEGKATGRNRSVLYNSAMMSERASTLPPPNDA